MQIACISNKQTNNKFVCTCSLSHRRSRHTHIRLLPPPTGNGGTHTQVYHRHVMETKLSPERITFLASGNAAFLYCSKKENQPHFNLLTNMMFVCKATHTRKIYIDTHAYKHMHMCACCFQKTTLSIKVVIVFCMLFLPFHSFVFERNSHIRRWYFSCVCVCLPICRCLR